MEMELLMFTPQGILLRTRRILDEENFKDFCDSSDAIQRIEEKMHRYFKGRFLNIKKEYKFFKLENYSKEERAEFIYNNANKIFQIKAQ